MSLETVYADFHNADTRGRVRLNCDGTTRDLADKGIMLKDGLRLTLSDDELEAEGVVHFAEEEKLWVAVISRSGRRLKESKENVEEEATAEAEEHSPPKRG